MNESSDEALRDLSCSAIKMLSHYRHDVMNDLQLIRGFLQLNKTERVMEYMEKAVERAQKMSVFSDHPDSLIAFILLDAQIRFSLLDLELMSDQLDQTMRRSTSEPTTYIYSTSLILQLRDLLFELGTFATQRNVKLYIDVDLSSIHSIRIQVSGNNEDMNWQQNLSVLPTLRSFKNDTLHNRIERVDTGFMLTIQEQEEIQHGGD